MAGTQHLPPGGLNFGESWTDLVMATLPDLIKWIRDNGNDPRRREPLLPQVFTWFQLWTAVDIIDDTESAIDVYLSSDFPTVTGEKYLRIYGVMQALFLQQDALEAIVKSIQPGKKIPKNDVLKEIRELRNASIGHPTDLNRGGASSVHGIVQHSMEKDGFQLHSHPTTAEGQFMWVPVTKLIERQRAESVRILSEVIEEIRALDEQHRSQFRDMKLITVFNQASHAFEKLFEEMRHSSPVDLGKWAVGQLKTTLDDFEKQLKERGLTLGTYDTIKYRYLDIEHPLAELKKYVSRQQSEISSDQTAIVFLEALRVYFDHLRDVAREIDEEYSSKPEPIP
jgi:hypothetical protein